jgi:hypothetical protein
VLANGRAMLPYSHLADLYDLWSEFDFVEWFCWTGHRQLMTLEQRVGSTSSNNALASTGSCRSRA